MSDVEFGLIQLCLHDEMVAVPEKSEASEKSAEKGSAMTKNMVVDFCFMIGDAIDAISSGDNRPIEWNIHMLDYLVTDNCSPCSDVHMLDYLGVVADMFLGVSVCSHARLPSDEPLQSVLTCSHARLPGISALGRGI